jgi:hypothetical protein
MTSTSEQWGEPNPTKKSIYKLFFYGNKSFVKDGLVEIGSSRDADYNWSGYVRCVRRFKMEN